jgi:hypothetical protein
MDFPFKGSWLVNYNPKDFSYPDILLTLARIQDVFKEKNIEFNSINIVFNKKAENNLFYKKNNAIFLNFSDIKADFKKTSASPCEAAIMEPLKKSITGVSLLFPRLENDPRWKTMGLPAAHLFLAANLQANGFLPTPMFLSLPNAILPAVSLAADMAGFTVFEDLLPLLRPFLARFKAVFNGWLAAGGPFPTLAPLAAAYHLPQINLFVRGEAEMELPGILAALNRGDAQALMQAPGLFWQQPGLIIMSDFDSVNRPETFSRFHVDLRFLRPEDMRHGLEMNFSRGCRRGCVFCCRSQGSEFRTLTLEKAADILRKYGEKIRELEPDGDQPRAMNINDDDILQDPAYAAAIFALVKKAHFRIIGVQTSTASLVRGDGLPREEVLDLAADPGLFVESTPLLWLGTDAFLPARARRLGKKILPLEKFAKLLSALEKRGLRHFHYWISSDNASTWEEFIEELGLICDYHRDFPNFGLLAHAPFIVPYPSSRLFQRLTANDPQPKTKLVLNAPDARFRCVVVEHQETRWPQFNNLLKNEKAGGEYGFFDFLKTRDFKAAAQLAYHYLKQEQLRSAMNDQGLERSQEHVEKLIGELLELRNT